MFKLIRISIYLIIIAGIIIAFILWNPVVHYTKEALVPFWNPDTYTARQQTAPPFSPPSSEQPQS